GRPGRGLRRHRGRGPGRGGGPARHARHRARHAGLADPARGGGGRPRRRRRTGHRAPGDHARPGDVRRGPPPGTAAARPRPQGRPGLRCPHSPAGVRTTAVKTTPSHVRRWRIGAVYAALVVAPAVLAVLLLGGGPGGSAAGSAAGAAHHDSGLARLLVTIAVVVICCKLAGRAAAGIGLPAVVGEIVAGIVLGPSVLGTLWAEAQAWLFPEETVDRLGVLADLGVVLFVFLAGTELNTRMLRRSGLAAVMVSHVGIALPLAGGVLLAFASSSVFAAEGASFPAFALFVGVAMSI